MLLRLHSRSLPLQVTLVRVAKVSVHVKSSTVAAIVSPGTARCIYRVEISSRSKITRASIVDRGEHAASIRQLVLREFPRFTPLRARASRTLCNVRSKRTRPFRFVPGLAVPPLQPTSTRPFRVSRGMQKFLSEKIFLSPRRYVTGDEGSGKVYTVRCRRTCII